MDPRFSYRELFKNVNSWLSFAEAKCGAIIVFNMAMITVLVSILDDYTNLIVQSILYICLTLQLISILISLLALVPFMNKIGNSDNNLLFYGDISKYEKTSLLIDAIEYRYKIDDVIAQTSANYRIDYVTEILTNSKIAKMKYKSFKNSTYISLASVVLLVIVLACLFILNCKEGICLLMAKIPL